MDIMKNIILCPECQGTGRLPRTKKKGKKKRGEIGISAYPRKLYPLKIEYVTCFRCGGLGTISNERSKVRYGEKKLEIC